MRPSSQRCLGLAVAALVANAATAASAQTLKMTTPIAPGVATPDRLETSIVSRGWVHQARGGVGEGESDGADPTTLGLFASIGIVKGKPFNPNERWQKILADAANIGAVKARTLALKIREPEAYFYPNSSWRLPFFGGSPTVRKVVR